jgi:hypothetical protein
VRTVVTKALLQYLLQVFGAPTHIFETATGCTAVLDRTENHTPIFQPENIKTDNNSITSDIEETNVYQENCEN